MKLGHRTDEGVYPYADSRRDFIATLVQCSALPNRRA